MARVVRFHETGGPEVLRIEQVEVPPPGKDEVRIRVHALGLNRAEAMFRGGQYLYTPRLPSRLGYEAAGTVEAIGAGVTGVLLGVGAAEVIASQEQDLVAEVRRITGGKGARVVFDPVGGPTVAKLTAAMARRGILFQYGMLSTEPTPLPLADVLGKSLTIRGYVLFEITNDPRRLERAKQFIIDGLAAGKLKPVIAKTFPLDQIVAAHRYLESNQQIGKIVVTV